MEGCRLGRDESGRQDEICSSDRAGTGRIGEVIQEIIFEALGRQFSNPTDRIVNPAFWVTRTEGSNPSLSAK